MESLNLAAGAGGCCAEHSERATAVRLSWLNVEPKLQARSEESAPAPAAAYATAGAGEQPEHVHSGSAVRFSDDAAYIADQINTFHTARPNRVADEPVGTR